MNNRNSGRRRSRGGRPNNRGPNDGNRLDNRARGNANQLCEKYKSMARDAHQQGDRVMNEYYLQFADHYFRVLTETNLRKEEQQRDREDNKPKRRADEADEQDERSEKSQPDDKPKKRQPRAKTKADAPDDEAQSIEADRLPAAISVAVEDEKDGKSLNGSSEDEKKPARRSRARKPGSDEDDKGAAAEA
ncbi:MAG: DUF4167 domain-containing protein [Parasphingopyxis sp.]|uniref:DUF4167 domain-containing protein n=1 Tax=Parasphingopyxis sp. TaxID=1920299 RepID=UPI003F9EF2B9